MELHWQLAQVNTCRRAAGVTRRSQSELRTRDWGRGTAVMVSGFRGSRATGRTPTPRRPNNRAAT